MIKLFKTVWKAFLLIMLCTTFLIGSGYAAPDLINDGPEQDSRASAVWDNTTQQKTISGKVMDVDGNPLPGANIVIKGTTTGVITDMDGNFEINVPDNAAILVISYIGYAAQEVAVGNLTSVEVNLEPDAQSLTEVTVVGYGTQSKAVITNAISTVNADQLADKAVVSFTEALVGQVAGVQIQQTSGAPGSGPVIKIRGVGSITGTGLPLYVIDGVPIDNVIGTSAVTGGWMKGQQPQNPMSSINPNDIESISILKDASSTAIYGSRGSNGVIIITTKSGTSGKSTVSLNVSHGWQTVAHKVDMMNTEEYVEMETDRRNWQWVLYGAGDNRQLDDPNSVRSSPNYKIPMEFSNPSTLNDEDWQDQMFQVAPMTTVSLSASGGNEKTRYYVSADYLNQDGVIINSGFEKFSLRANIDSDISDKVKIGLRMTPTYSKSNMTRATGYGGNIAHGIMNIAPIYKAYNDDGSYDFGPIPFTYGDGTSQQMYWGNPIAKAIEYDFMYEQYRLLTSVFASWEITKGLILKSSISADINYFSMNSFQPTTMGRPGTVKTRGDLTDSRNYNWVNENTLTYARTFSENHNLSALAGFTAQKSLFENNSMYASDFPNNEVRTLNAGTVTGGGQVKSEWSLLSFLGRVNYDYKKKYLLTATVRRDGSSRFGADTRWGTFPSASVGWRISEEAFLKNSKLISELKLRASYGLTGNNDISNYGSYGSVGGMNYILGTGNGEIVNGLVQGSISNPALSWEETTEMDLGVELGLFNNRLYLNIDYYNSLTSGLLLNVPVPLITGFSSALQNIGEVRNKGVEISLDAEITKSKNFTWNANFNISFNDNVVESMGLTDAPIIVGPRNFFNELAYITTVGSPIGSFYGYTAEGVYMTQADADADPAKFNDKVGAGDMKFKDISGPDGVPDGKLDSYDQGVIGNNVPDFIYGISTRMTFFGFDFNFTLQGTQGVTVLNGNKRNMYRWFSGQGKDYWRSEAEPGDGWTWKPGGVYQNRNVSTWWHEDASFLRIKDLTLGYTIPVRGNISKLRVYANVMNLHTFTSYFGYNPEVNSGEGDDYMQLTPGLDFGTYPIARTFTLGFNLQF